MAEVYVVKLSEAMKMQIPLLSALTGLRKDKALRYLQEEDQIRSAVGTLLIRKFVGDGITYVHAKGKPYIVGARSFNLSHAGNYIGIAVDDHEVGFDVDCIDRCEVEIARAAFTDEEAAEVHDKESFCLAWTRKEAIAKCQGDGLREPRKYGVTPQSDGTFLYRSEVYHASSLIRDGHIFCIASKDGPVSLEPVLLQPKDLID